LRIADWIADRGLRIAIRNESAIRNLIRNPKSNPQPAIRNPQSAMLTVLCLIPARGGSKGIERKNIRPLAGKPLLQYTAEAALAARRLSHVVLSTDDEEIASVGRQCGLDVPFMRPRELARDSTPTLPVVQHAVRWLEERGARFDAVCLLQPTNPLRRAGDIDACIALLEESGADAVITVLPVPPEYNPHWVYFQAPDRSLRLSTGEGAPIARRQDLRPAFHREGSVYVTRRDAVMESNTLYGDRTVGYVMPAGDSVNIDDLADWERAEALLSQP
jgi:CMP-N,N'-diacetyllegionaminic acid synthase